MQSNYIAFWDTESQSYKWYDKPEAAKGGQPVEVTVNGGRPVVCVFNGRTVSNEEGELAEIYEPVANNAYARKSKYFAFEPAPSFGSVKMPAEPVCPKYMKSRKKLLAQIRRGR